jgi:hypothetical protein
MKETEKDMFFRVTAACLLINTANPSPTAGFAFRKNNAICKTKALWKTGG